MSLTQLELEYMEEFRAIYERKMWEILNSDIYARERALIWVSGCGIPFPSVVMWQQLKNEKHVSFAVAAYLKNIAEWCEQNPPTLQGYLTLQFYQVMQYEYLKGGGVKYEMPPVSDFFHNLLEKVIP